MSSDSYKAALEAARDELGQLSRQREQIDGRITQLAKIIEGLVWLIESEAAIQADSAALAAEDGIGLIDQEAGITPAIKRVFEVFGTAGSGVGVVSLTPIDVRQGLVLAGWDLNKHPNHMATIHSVLKRLDEQGWLEKTDKDGKPAYQRTVLSTYTPSPWLKNLAEMMAPGKGIVDPVYRCLSDANARIDEMLSNYQQQTNETIMQAFANRRLGPRPEGRETENSSPAARRKLGPKPEKKS